jgi:hypothetical protein
MEPENRSSSSAARERFLLAIIVKGSMTVCNNGGQYFWAERGGYYVDVGGWMAK